MNYRCVDKEDDDWLTSLSVDEKDKAGIYDAYLDYCCMIAAGYAMPSVQWWWCEVGKEYYEEDRVA